MSQPTAFCTDPIKYSLIDLRLLSEVPDRRSIANRVSVESDECKDKPDEVNNIVNSDTATNASDDRYICKPSLSGESLDPEKHEIERFRPDSQDSPTTSEIHGSKESFDRVGDRLVPQNELEPRSMGTPLIVQFSWSDGKKKHLQAEILDPDTNCTFCYVNRVNHDGKQDERDFFTEFADRIEQDLGRQVQYSIPKESIPSAKKGGVSTKAVLISGAILFVIGFAAGVVSFDMKFMGLSVQMWALIIFAIILVSYFRHHDSRIARVLMVLYWSFACFACVLQVQAWIQNRSFVFFRSPYANEGTKEYQNIAGEVKRNNTGESETTANSSSIPVGMSKSFLETLQSLGEFEAKTVNGTGDSVVQIPCWPYPCLINIAYGGKGNFAVKSYDENGDYTDLLVNTIGSYTGQVTTYEECTKSSQLEITASGDWAMTFRPMSEMTKVEYDPSEDFAGGVFDGDGVVYIDEEKINSLVFMHDGEGNFSVKAIAQMDSKLLVNTIGEYSGNVIWNEPKSFFIVHADGSWGIAWQHIE